jgi:hypothetical protein
MHRLLNQLEWRKENSRSTVQNVFALYRNKLVIIRVFLRRPPTPWGDSSQECGSEARAVRRAICFSTTFPIETRHRRIAGAAATATGQTIELSMISGPAPELSHFFLGREFRVPN